MSLQCPIFHQLGKEGIPIRVPDGNLMAFDKNIVVIERPDVMTVYDIRPVYAQECALRE